MKKYSKADIVACLPGSLLQNAGLTMQAGTTLTLPGSASAGGSQNVYMVIDRNYTVYRYPKSVH